MEMQRAAIQIPVVTSKLFDDGIGYIKVNSFSENVDTLFSKEMELIQKQGANGLIVDFRGNPGGYLDTAKSIAEQFIDQGTLINTIDRNSMNDPITISNGKSVSYPVVVLVDQYSASASEVVAGALQDYQLATIIGTQYLWQRNGAKHIAIIFRWCIESND